MKSPFDPFPEGAVLPGSAIPHPPSPIPSPEHEAWARARWADVLRREGSNSLEVGPDKPLGSIGIPSGSSIGQAWPVIRSLFRLAVRGYWYKQYGIFSSTAETGTWFYAWHRKSLFHLLTKNHKVLVEAGEPWASLSLELALTESKGSSNAVLERFVQATRDHKAVPGTRMFDVIADAYGDKTGPGRTDVFPELSRSDLLEVFYAVYGFPEDTSVFFLSAGLPVPGWPESRP